ncbi:MAG: DUF6838 family protein [Moorella sp. (in: firmicutes)]
MTYNDIRETIIGKLRAKYPTYSIYGEEDVEHGVKAPAFFVQLLPVSSRPVSPAHTQRTLMIDVHYFSAAKTYGDLWSMAEELEGIFDLELTIADRSITIQDKEPEVIEGVLHFKFTVDYIESKEGIEVALDTGEIKTILPEPDLGYIEGQVEPMRELEVKEEI